MLGQRWPGDIWGWRSWRWWHCSWSRPWYPWQLTKVQTVLRYSSSALSPIYLRITVVLVVLSVLSISRDMSAYMSTPGPGRAPPPQWPPLVSVWPVLLTDGSQSRLIWWNKERSQISILKGTCHRAFHLDDRHWNIQTWELRALAVLSSLHSRTKRQW